MEKQIQINDLSVSELKVLSYDLLANLEQTKAKARANLQKISQLIANKSNKPKEAPKEEDKAASGKKETTVKK